jgi:hypothetical protein
MPYFTRERFGRPQFFAAALLLAFLGQALWLVHAQLSASTGMDLVETTRIGEGWKQWHGRGIAASPFSDPAAGAMQDPLVKDASSYDPEHSPLLYLASAGPLLAWPRDLNRESEKYWRWLPRLPFLACGVFLGASLWYVARRLCGNHGGLVALTLYAFSPALIQSSAVWHTEPQIAAAWGAFGTIFTAIAVAHTLYAPREVVLWNWRRIVLLGVALAIAVGAEFPMIVLMPMALGFLFYVAPVRRKAGFVIWLAGCGMAALMIFAVYFFHGQTLAASVSHATFWDETWRGFGVWGVYKQVGVQMGRACPAFAVLVPSALIAYILWPRTRYLGNTGPLLVAVTFVALGIAYPQFEGAGFFLAAVPFLFIFVSGVLSDLMETQQRPLVTACVIGLLLAYVAHTLLTLSRVPMG